MSKATAFFGGVPWEPDVRRLLNAFGTPKPGLITHEKIEAVIDADWRSDRYRGVVGAWRKHLRREMNIDTDADPGKGIRILTERERIEVTTRDFRGVVRKTRKTFIRGGAVEVTKLDDISRRKHDHLMHAVANTVAVATTSAKQLTSALKSPPQLPRRSHG
jgi:hypothetical protein